MKLTPACVFVAAALSNIGSAEADAVIIRCVGHIYKPPGQATHYIELDGSAAQVDGVPYSVETTSTQYTLLGPITEENSDIKATWHMQFLIDRVEGSYLLITPDSYSKNKVIEGSRPQDPGCKKVKQKL